MNLKLLKNSINRIGTVGNNYLFSVLMMLVLFAFTVQTGFAQCNISTFTATPVNGVCAQDGAVQIDVPGASGCLATATLRTVGGTSNLQSITLNGNGVGAFNNLDPGTYEVRLQQGSTVVGPKTITVTSTYQPFTANVVAKNISCRTGDPLYTANGTVTATVSRAGNYVYEIKSLNLTSGQTNNTSWTFNNLGPGTYQVSVTEYSSSTCIVSRDYGFTISNYVGASLGNAFTSTNFYEVLSTTNCNAWNIAIGKGGVFGSNAALITKVLTEGYMTISYGGNTYPAVNGNMQGVSDPAGYFSNVPPNTPVTIKISDGCKEISYSYTTDPIDRTDFNFIQASQFNSDLCGPLNYITVEQTLPGNGNPVVSRLLAYRPNPSNTITYNFYEEVPINSGNWVLIESANETGVILGLTSDLGIGRNFPNLTSPTYNLQQGHKYRVEIVDNSCNTPPIHKDFIYNQVEATAPIERLSLSQTTSVIEGTAGISLGTTNAGHVGLDYSLRLTKWVIERTDGVTSYTYSATDPYNLAADVAGKTITFPYEVTFDHNKLEVRQVFNDLPLGSYRITGYDLVCNKSGTATITLTKAANYDPVVSVSASSCGANTITYKMAQINVHPLQFSTKLYTAGAGGTLGNLVATNPSANRFEGEFTNLQPGDYILNLDSFQIGGSVSHSVAVGGAKNSSDGRDINVSVKVLPRQEINFTTATLYCDPSNANTGIIAVSVTGQPVGFINYKVWLSTANPDTDPPLQQYNTTNLSEKSYVFKNLSPGKYIVRVTTNCEFKQQEVTIAVGAPILPEPIAGPPEVCAPGKLAVLSVALSESVFDIVWKNGTTQIGTGSSVNVNPTVTSTYTVEYVLKSSLGCANVTPTTANVTVTVNTDAGTVNAGPDQSLAGTTFTMNANQLTSVNSQGTWTVVSVKDVNGNSLANSTVQITNVNAYNTQVIIPAASTVEMKWTVTNAECSGEDNVILISTESIDAIDDNMSSIPVVGHAGNANVVNILTNDVLNGTPNIPAASVIISIVTPATPVSPGANVPVVNTTTGVVSVPAGTPAGTYVIEYKICTVNNTCDTATATVVVEAAEIVANNDSFGPINGYNGGNTPSVLDNDTLNGQPVNPSEITLTPGTPSHPGLTMNPDGTITVAPQTPAGTYTYEYTICEVLNPTNCDTAVATVVVEAAEIVANNDSFGPINGYNGGNTPSVLDNDTLNGQPVNPSEITLTPGASSNPGLTMNPDGTITVDPQTPAGTYTYEYTICEVLNPTNCDTAVATVVVEAAEIVANNDPFGPINGYNGGNTPSVLDNDTLNGQPVNPSEITLTPGASSNPGLTMNPDGTITVAPQTPAGTYTYEYTICEVLNPTNCDTAVATVVVEAAEIVANNDSFGPINGYNGGTTPSVLDNDTLNGDPVNPSEITLTPGTPSHPGLTMNPDGTITAAPQTPAGTYTYEYTICEVLNPTNCDTAVATVVVEAAEIVANNDSFGPINGYNGGNTPSVLDNDTLNGQPVNPSEITLTPGASSNPGLTMNPDGTITVAPQTPAGTYTYEYTICEVLNPTNCDTAVATVVVEAAEIVANNDPFAPINGYVGGNTTSVLENDTLNGQPVNPSEITLTPGTPSNPGLTMNPDGTITVAPQTPAGTYTYEYTICEVLNPTNCDTAVATVVVEAAEIVANNDSFGPINGYNGGNTPSVLDNDTLNGQPVNPSEITLTPGTPSHPGLTMNPDGTITVAPQTPAGTYTYEYTICEVLNPTNCDTAVATVVVEAAEIVANNDSFNQSMDTMEVTRQAY